MGLVGLISALFGRNGVLNTDTTTPPLNNVSHLSIWLKVLNLLHVEEFGSPGPRRCPNLAGSCFDFLIRTKRHCRLFIAPMFTSRSLVGAARNAPLRSVLQVREQFTLHFVSVFHDEGRCLTVYPNVCHGVTHSSLRWSEGKQCKNIRTCVTYALN